MLQSRIKMFGDFLVVQWLILHFKLKSAWD